MIGQSHGAPAHFFTGRCVRRSIPLLDTLLGPKTRENVKKKRTSARDAPESDVRGAVEGSRTRIFSQRRLAVWVRIRTHPSTRSKGGRVPQNEGVPRSTHGRYTPPFFTIRQSSWEPALGGEAVKSKSKDHSPAGSQKRRSKQLQLASPGTPFRRADWLRGLNQPVQVVKKKEVKMATFSLDHREPPSCDSRE